MKVNDIRVKIFISGTSGLEDNIIGSPLEVWNIENPFNFTLYMKVKLIEDYNREGVLELCLVKYELIDEKREIRERILGEIELNDVNNKECRIENTREKYKLAFEVMQQFNNVQLIGEGYYELAIYKKNAKNKKVLDTWQFKVRK